MLGEGEENNDGASVGLWVKDIFQGLLLTGLGDEVMLVFSRPVLKSIFFQEVFWFGLVVLPCFSCCRDGDFDSIFMISRREEEDGGWLFAPPAPQPVHVDFVGDSSFTGDCSTVSLESLFLSF